MVVTTILGGKQTGVFQPAFRTRLKADWRRSYASRLMATDLLVLTWAILGAGEITVNLFEPLTAPAWMHFLHLNYLAVTVLLVACWVAALAAFGSRDYRRLGTGLGEY